MTTKPQATKEKYRIGSQKLKKFLNQKTQKKRVKRKPKELEKIFANHISNKKVIFRICMKKF